MRRFVDCLCTFMRLISWIKDVVISLAFEAGLLGCGEIWACLVDQKEGNKLNGLDGLRWEVYIAIAIAKTESRCGSLAATSSFPPSLSLCLPKVEVLVC